MIRSTIFITLVTLIAFTHAAVAQPPQPPPAISPEVHADRRITFRLLAPQVEKVRLVAGDIPGMGPGKDMTKGENGLWEITVGPIDSGAGLSGNRRRPYLDQLAKLFE